MKKKILNGIVKGDTINLRCKLNEDITDWKIRSEVYDSCSNCIKLASVNAGGSVDQIERTDDINGEFIVHVAKDLTTCFADKGYIEIEVETNDTVSEKFTVLPGSNSEINFLKEEITWDTP